MRRIETRILLTACCLALLAAPLLAQRASDLGMLNRLRDETQRRDGQFATLKLDFDGGTLTSALDKYVPSALLVRAELDGRPLKLSRGTKPKVLEGLSSGTIVITVERPLHGTRQRAECTGYLAGGRQEVAIYPQGDLGVQCQFYDVGGPRLARRAQIKTLPSQRIPDWQLTLPFEQFAAVGECHNDHEAGSNTFWSCVETAGVSRPAAG